MKKTKKPRVLIISNTLINYKTATGALVKDLFTGWPKASLLQVYTYHQTDFDYEICDNYVHLSSKGYNLSSAIKHVKDFQPDIIYIRLVDEPLALMLLAEKLIDETDIPLVTHIMDDWAERSRVNNHESYNKQVTILQKLLNRAHLNLSISDKMKNAFEKRYKVPFQVISNFIDKDYWKTPTIKTPHDKFTVRYTGSLSPDMQLYSVLDIAIAIEVLSQEIPITLELYAGQWFINQSNNFNHLKATIIKPFVQRNDYKDLLCSADLLILPVNFDDLSLSYVRYSMSNKLPEYLASGTPILAYGPIESATIEIFCKKSWGKAVTDKDIPSIVNSIKQIYANIDKYIELATLVKKSTINDNSAETVRDKFQNYFMEIHKNINSSIQKHDNKRLIGDYPRGSDINFNESNIIAQYLDTKSKVMVNVGAHTGGSLSPFVSNGWKVYAFEPDAKNRAILTNNFGKHPMVTIDCRAVSNKSANDVPFFTSNVSTGISSLTAFHNTHKESAKVTVTTLNEFCNNTKIEHIDFLLIDTEGFDLFVLQGLDWDKVQPDVIICEFEDRKTKTLGYSFYDLANFLSAKDYEILVSEWHPIRRYGIRHDWRRLVQYPCELADENAWGNIIAFRSSPDWQKLMPILSREAVSSTHIAPLTSTLRKVKSNLLRRLLRFYW